MTTHQTAFIASCANESIDHAAAQPLHSERLAAATRWRHSGPVMLSMSLETPPLAQTYGLISHRIDGPYCCSTKFCRTK